MDVTFKPIIAWPGKMTPATKRRRGPFSVTFAKGLKLLERELEHQRAFAVVVQTAHLESEIRQDGMPRATAKRPAHPGVILSFSTPEEHLSFPCDTYEDWQDNLRAIVLTLESLRAIDRYGATRRREQYQGWKQLPPAREPTSREKAAEFLARHSTLTAPLILNNMNVCETAYREAAGRLHPDRGGTHDDFVRLQDAIAALRSRSA